MNNNRSTLLPFIMDALSRENNLCTTVEELTAAVRDVVLEEHVRPFNSLEHAVKFALEVGSNLGILTMTDDMVPTPFNFRARMRGPTRRITAAEGRKLIKKALTVKNTEAKLKSKVKACAAKRSGKKTVEKLPLPAHKIGKSKTVGKAQKPKPKKRT